MNIKGFRRMLFGEKMPDKNDPQYKERYEREIEAGRKFAKATRIDVAAAKVQKFANLHRNLFLVIRLCLCFRRTGMEHLPYHCSVSSSASTAHRNRNTGFHIEGTAKSIFLTIRT